MTVAAETGADTGYNSGIRYPIDNQTGLPDSLINESPQIREIANQLSNWADSARAAVNRSSLFDRGAYAAPDNVYEQMKMAQRALENDDVCSSLAEVTEGLAFQTLTWESESADEADIFGQIAFDLDLDSLIRQLWREDFGISQVVCATWWGRKTYTVRGRSAPAEVAPPEPGMPAPKRPKGAKRRKKYDLVVPVAITVLDHQKIVPCGLSMFGRERLCYRASKEEMAAFQGLQDGSLQEADPILTTLLMGKYTPTGAEKADLVRIGVDPTRLLECNPNYVWRYTSTKSAYQRFAPIRLKSVFRLLDLKQQMMESDRVHLIGAANYILLVKKGDKEFPAQQPEIDNLNANFKYVAKLPVIVSDHRLSIEIVAPKNDFTLNADRYDTLDNAILHRLLGTISGTRHGSESSRGSSGGSMSSKATARNLENRRHMLARKLEREIAQKIVEHPLNHGVFEERPSLAYQPRHIEMGVDAAVMQAVLMARTNGEISRGTFLEELGFDQAIEAMRREYEDEMYPDVFKPIAVPFSSPALAGEDYSSVPAGGDSGGSTPAKKALPAGRGGRGPANGGGRPTGGGQSPANTTRAKPQTGRGNPSTRST